MRKINYIIVLFMAIIVCGCSCGNGTDTSTPFEDLPIVYESSVSNTTNKTIFSDVTNASDIDETSVTISDKQNIVYNDLVCEIKNNNEISVVQYKGNEKHLVIPEMINGYYVSEVTIPLHSGNKYSYEADKDVIEKLTIPATVKHLCCHNCYEGILDDGIFGSFDIYGKNCTTYYIDKRNPYFTSIDGVIYTSDMKQLVDYPKAKTDVSFSIPDTVEIIWQYALTECLFLKDLNIPSSVKYFYDASKCPELTSVELPEGIEKIYSYAFSGCVSLQSITLPASVKEVGEMAFAGCKGLRKVTIPSGSNFRMGVFKDCKIDELIMYPAGEILRLEDDIIKFNVTEDIDGTVYEVWFKMLPQSAVETVVVSSNIEIGGDTFSGCESLKEFIVLDGFNVDRIAGDDFDNCPSLERMYIPSSVQCGCIGTFNENNGVTIYTQKGSSADIDAKRFGLDVVYVDSYEEYKTMLY